MRRVVLLVLLAVLGAPGAAPSAMLGEQRVLLMLVTWGPEPYTVAQARQTLDETAAFVRSASFGRTSIVGEVTPWLHVLDTRPGCELERIRTAALAATRARGYDTTRYTTLGIAVPPIGCRWGGAYFDPGIWVNGVLNRHVLAHELGHTYGVIEEGPAWVCDRGCHSVPYLDPFSVMGHGWSDYGAWEKFQFGWLDGVPRASRAGAFSLGAIDRLSSEPQALRVVVAGDEYWFEYRPAPPLWAYGSREAAPGVVVHAGSNGLGEAGRFPGRNYLVFDPARRGRPSIQPGETFSVAGAFTVAVSSAGPETAGLSFRWSDRTRPARPRLLRPLRRGSRLIVRWRRGIERGSGLAAHEISVDGRLVARVQAVRETAGLLVVSDDRLTLRLPRGRHRLAVLAVDRAGNRSSLARAVARF
jgi:hypothetical protein